MPLYDYKCECGKEREVLFRTLAAAEEPVICECGKVMKRVFPLFGMAEVKGRARVFQPAIAQPWRHKR